MDADAAMTAGICVAGVIVIVLWWLILALCGAAAAGDRQLGIDEGEARDG